MNYDQMIAVLQAAKEGKAIQRLLKVPGSKWEDDPKPPGDFACYFYRVKPEPRVFYAVLREDTDQCTKKFFACRDRELAEKLAYPLSYKVVKLVEVLDDSMEAPM